MDTIDPWSVRFSHDSICNTFRDGRTIDELAFAVRAGIVSAFDVEAIRLVERDSRLYTLDNRRLEAFRRADVAVAYRMATAEEAEDAALKFTSHNDGLSIRVR